MYLDLVTILMLPFDSSEHINDSAVQIPTSD
jgi:hypothetical protein